MLVLAAAGGSVAAFGKALVRRKCATNARGSTGAALGDGPVPSPARPDGRVGSWWRNCFRRCDGPSTPGRDKPVPYDKQLCLGQLQEHAVGGFGVDEHLWARLRR